MATSVNLEPDKRFIYDNLLLNDDWGRLMSAASAGNCHVDFMFTSLQEFV